MNGEGVMEVVRVVGERVVPVLLHSLWQAALVAGALWALLKLMPGGAARRRYAMSLCALLAVVVCGLGTWAWLGRGEPVKQSPVASLETARAQRSVPVMQGGVTLAKRVDPAQLREEPFEEFEWKRCKEWAGAMWLVGAGMGLLRCLFDLAGAGALMRSARVTENATWLGALKDVRKALGMKDNVGLAVSRHVAVPMVVGFLRPMVLIPGFAAPRLTGEELRLILAHELAHVRRHDLWVGLFQAMVEALLFFNPAARWISRQVRIERECCCDQDASRVCPGGAAEYVQMLARWVSRDVMTETGGVVGRMAISGGRPGGVLERATRLLFPDRVVSRKLPLWLVGVGVGAYLTAGAAAGALAQTVTQTVVRALSPEERVEVMTKAQPVPMTREERIARVPSPDIDLTMSAVPGRKLAPGGQLKFYSQSRDAYMNSMSTGTSVLNAGNYTRFNAVGDFKDNVWISLIEKNTGVTVKGPFVAQGREVIQLKGRYAISIALEAGGGRVRSVRVLNQAGKGVPGAMVTASAAVGGMAANKFDGGTLGVTDENGRLEFPVDSPVKVMLEVYAAGAEPGTLFMEPDGPADETLTLKPARPVTGRLAWAKTGEPAAGLSVRVLGYENKHGTSGLSAHSMSNRGAGGDPKWGIAKTDAQGRFSIDMLDPAMTYVLRALDEKETTLAVMTGVKSGHDLGDVAVGLSRLSGRVIDSDNLLADGKGEIQKISMVGGASIGKVMLKRSETGELLFDVPAEPMKTLLTYNGQGRHATLFEEKLEAGQEKVGLVLDLGKALGPRPKPVPVTVRIQVPTGETAPVGLLAFDPELDGLSELHFTKEDAGKKTVMLVPGVKYQVGPRTQFPGFKSKEVAFTLAAAGPAKEVVVELEQNMAVVGQVVLADGTPWRFFTLRLLVERDGKRSRVAESELESRPRKGGGGFVLDKGLTLGKTYIVQVVVQAPSGREEIHELGPYPMTRERSVWEGKVVAGETADGRKSEPGSGGK